MSRGEEGHAHRGHKPAARGEPQAAPGPQDASAPRPDEAARAGEGAAPPAPENPLAAKTRECRELVDQLQRLAAEFSNYQKRTQRRIEEEQQRAVRDLVLDLLPGVDNLERAIAAARTPEDFQALRDGVRLVHGLMLEALRKHGITPIEAEGKAFDPEHHEAVAHLPHAEHPQGQVIEEMERGYRFHGQTLRASRVSISSGRPAAEGGEGPPPPNPPGAARGEKE